MVNLVATNFTKMCLRNGQGSDTEAPISENDPKSRALLVIILHLYVKCHSRFLCQFLFVFAGKDKGVRMGGEAR